jgi:hypothetical protein
MGRMYVASVLLAIAGKSQPANVTEVELEPIVPGVWAAWARCGDAAPAVTASQPTTATSSVATRPAPSASQA